jgi:hypothetical protein
MQADCPGYDQGQSPVTQSSSDGSMPRALEPFLLACLSAEIETADSPKTAEMGTGSGYQPTPDLNQQGLGRWGITGQREMFAVADVPGARHEPPGTASLLPNHTENHVKTISPYA